jgi:ribonuclease HI
MTIGFSSKQKPSHPIQLYADGGVIDKNPSPIGGTWAWILVDSRNDQVLDRNYGVIIHTETIPMSEDGTVTNNQTELFALLQGLSKLPIDALVEVRSDSNVSLGRLFRGWQFSNIPWWMKTSLDMQISRLVNWNQFTYTLMDGHPTALQLRSGFGKRRNVTSKWNVACDALCHLAADEYKERIR